LGEPLPKELLITMSDTASAPRTEAQLNELLTVPNDATVHAVQQLGGDLLILGAGGKMGPSLALLAQRSLQAAGVPHQVHCASRFSSPAVAEDLRGAGIRVTGADLLQPGALESLPDTPNVIFLVGMKFGSTGAEPLTWMLNTFVPGLVARRFASSRIVALSTGNVYPFVPVHSGGATEQSPLAPRGDYAQSCVGRERMFQHGSLAHGTPVAILRLNYANDLRYGVLRDIAERVLAGHPIDLGMGNVNLIWQGDANRVILQAFSICSSPAHILNLTGPEMVPVRWLAEQFGAIFGHAPVFTGAESGEALLSNAAECHRLFGYPRVTLLDMVHWTAEWVQAGGRSLAKPTHFETRDGKY
jgi:nucleoside-diphosphate-sugar epimerase